MRSADVGTPVTAQFPAPESAGTAVRVIAQSGGIRHVSSVVFLTDTARCRPRGGQSAAPRLTRDYTQIFTDSDLLARFEHDLLNLVRANAMHRGGQGQASGTRPAVVDDTDRWGSWLQDLETLSAHRLHSGCFPSHP